jgi:long-chain acyl-CoA synthetase
MRAKHHGIWQPYTWSEVEKRIRFLASGLAAIGLGRGDVLGIVSENLMEVYLLEYAALSRGATVTCMYPDVTPEEMAFILGHSEAVVLVAEDQEQVDKALAIADRLPNLRHVVYLDDRGLWHYSHPLLLDYKMLFAKGEERNKAEPGRFDADIEAVRQDDLAVLCYTSGTTGAPKGVMLTHRYLLDNAYRLMASFEIRSGIDYLSYISPAWAAEQVIGLALGLLAPMVVNFAEKPEMVQHDLRELGPEFLLFTPRQWEMMASSVQTNMMDADSVRQWFYDWAIRIAKSAVTSKPTGVKRWILSLRLAIAEMLVFRAIRDNLGLKRASVVLNAGSGLSAEIFNLFHWFGVPLRNLFGATEIGLLTAHWGGEFDPNTMGRLLVTDPTICSMLSVRVDSDQELHVSGGSGFHGYFRDVDATAKVRTPEGEYRTGDAVQLTKDGQFVYLDRVKFLRKLSSGHAYPPQFIENHLRASPFIKDAVIIGDEGRPFVVALINIDGEIMGHFAEKWGLSFGTFTELSQLLEVRKQVGASIDRVNALLEEGSRVVRFATLPKELDPDDSELTRSRKLKRDTIESRYKEIIDAIYDGTKECRTKVVIQYTDGTSATMNAVVAINETTVAHG